MTFAVEVRAIDEASLARLREAVRRAHWKAPDGRGYDTAPVPVEAAGYRSTPVRAFFLRLRSGGKLHRHRDVGDVETEHVVIETNEDARNFWLGAGGIEHSMHMEVGKVYRVDRTLEHWAVNHGDTDRIHLLVEFPK